MDYKLTPSFGRRKARKLRETSQKIYTELLPRLKIDPQKKCFGFSSPHIWLEIGFGGGEHMLERLSQNPSVAIIGCEPFMNGVAKFLGQLLPQDYPRVKIWHDDVRYLLNLISPSSFERVFILFPDPWPKKRHHRRRLITNEFINKLLPTLREKAFLHIASDDPSYVEQIQNVLYPHPDLILCTGPVSPDPLSWGGRPVDWPSTRYESKAMTAGKKCAYMLFQKKENST